MAGFKRSSNVPSFPFLPFSSDINKAYEKQVRKDLLHIVEEYESFCGSFVEDSDVSYFRLDEDGLEVERISSVEFNHYCSQYDDLISLLKKSTQ